MGSYCDDKLEGLPFSPRLDLVGVPEGDQCLHRIDDWPGVWQHDPSLPGGADFVGPLRNLEASMPAALPSGVDAAFGFIPLITEGADRNGKPTMLIGPQSLGEVSSGFMAALRTDGRGKWRFDKIVPTALSTCPANLFLFGFIETVRTCGGVSYTDYEFKKLDSLTFPDAQLTKFIGSDLLDQDHFRTLGMKKTGDCWTLGLLPASGCSYATALLETDVFDAVTVCKDGVSRTLPAFEGKMLVGNADGKWALTDGSVGMVDIASEPVIYTRTLAAVPTNNTDTYDLTGAPGYSADYKFVWVQAEVSGNTSSADYVTTVSVENRNVAGCRVTAAADSSRDFGIRMIPIPVGKVITIAETCATGTPGGSYNYQCHVKIIAWQK